MAEKLDNLFGVILICLIISSSLLGVLTIQVYAYYTRFKNDPLWMKCWIAAAYVLDVLHQIFGSWTSYHYTINKYSCFPCLENVHWSVGAMIVCEPLSAALTQLWFARRQYQFDKQRVWLVVITVALSLISTIAGLGTAIQIFYTKYFSQFGGNRTWRALIWTVSGFVCDVLVTVPIAWSLYNTRTAFRSTNRTTTRLAIWIINTGALTTILALFVTVTFLTDIQSLIYVALHAVLESMYSNSLLAFLNRRGRRDRIVDLADDILLSRVGPPSVNASEPQPLPTFTRRRSGPDEFWGRDQ